MYNNQSYGHICNYNTPTLSNAVNFCHFQSAEHFSLYTFYYFIISTLLYYGRPLHVTFCECYFFKFFLWPPYAPAQVNGGSRNFYTWWILSVNREVTTWIFSWSSLNYRVFQKVRNLAYFQTPPANFLLSHPNAAEYCNSEKNLLSIDGCSTRVPGLVNFGLQTHEIHASYYCFFSKVELAAAGVHPVGMISLHASA